MTGREFDPGRRRLLKQLAFGLGALATGCVSVSIPPPPSPTPYPEIKPTPTPEKSIQWTTDLLIPPKLPSGKEVEAFFVTDDKLFFATPDGYPAAFTADGKKLWEWPEKGTVYGTEPETVYVVRYDKRLYALDAQTNQTKWKAIFGIDESTRVDWPLWIAPNCVFLPFKRENRFLMGITNKTETVWPGNQLSPDMQIIGQLGSTLLFLSFIDSKRRILAVDFPSSWESGKQLWADDDLIPGDLIPVKIKRTTEILGLSQNRIYLRVTENDEKYYRRYLSLLDLLTGSVWESGDTSVYGNLGFAGEAGEIAILNDKSLGFTYGIEISTGKQRWKNDDFALDSLAGFSKGLLMGIRNNPNRLYGLNLANGEQKWYWDLYQLTARPVIHQDKIVYGSGPYALVLDVETGKNVRNAPITFREGEITRIIPAGDLLLVQTGKPGGRGTLSAVKI